MEQLQQLRNRIEEIDKKIEDKTEELNSLNSERYDLMEKKWSLVRHMCDNHHPNEPRANIVSEFK